MMGPLSTHLCEATSEVVFLIFFRLDWADSSQSDYTTACEREFDVTH